MLALAIFLALASPASKDDVVMVTDWFVTVTENDVERTMQPVDPPPAIAGGSERHFSIAVDQHLAPGWSCEVLPETWRGTNRSRWLTCQNGGRAKVSIRTSCRSDRSGARVQELWLGDNVSIELACRSGISP